MSKSTRPDRVAVIDIGKTNAKVVVIDTGTGEEIASKKRAEYRRRTGDLMAGLTVELVRDDDARVGGRAPAHAERLEMGLLLGDE